MRRTQFTTRVWIGLAALFAAMNASAQTPASPRDVARRLAVANNAFALELYAKLSAQPGNLVVGTHPVHMALTLVNCGARADTAAQMAKVLHLTMAPEVIGVGYASFRESLGYPGRRGIEAMTDNTNPFFDSNAALGGLEIGFVLRTATGLFNDADYPLRESFAALVGGYFNSDAQTVEFANADETVRQINDWCTEDTKGKLTNLLPLATLTSRTHLGVASGSCFSSRWHSEFDPENTSYKPFQLTPAKSVELPLMSQQDIFSCGELDDTQVIELPYFLGHLSMIVVLPKKTDGLAELEKSLTMNRINLLIRAMKRQKCAVVLPRFRVASQFRLDETLQALGMPQVFDARAANLTGLSRKEQLGLDFVFHKVWVEVNEKGTDAGGGTIVGKTPAPIPDILTFKADHPFLFLVVHKQTGTILFLGRVTDPR